MKALVLIMLGTLLTVGTAMAGPDYPRQQLSKPTAETVVHCVCTDGQCMPKEAKPQAKQRISYPNSKIPR